jgi:glycerol-1-phosphate dehydrogenase [NAD(P)+]
MSGPHTSALTALPDPTVLPALREALATEDPDRRLVPLDLDRIVIGPDAVDSVADVVAEQLGRTGRSDPGPIVVLVDATRIERAGVDLKALVEELLAGRFGTERDVRQAVLRGHHPTLHVDDDTLDAATAAITGASAVVSLGGGTISDIAKVATARVAAATADAGGIPLVVVQTAASVDGYTDNVSVVLRDGVKRTIPSRWPDVVVADTTTISTAPARLNTSGYGEVLSTFTAPADWYLASVVGLDPSFHPAPRDLLTIFGRGVEKWSPGVSQRDLDAIEQLTRVLALRGLVSGVAGTTACVSGVEHVVSHMLDMYHGAVGQPIGLHGAQVGVASVIAAAAWEHLFAVFDPAAVPVDDLFPGPDAIAARRPTVLAAFADLDPGGRLGEECWRDYSTKLARWSGGRATVEAALGDWDRHRAVIEEMLVGPRTLGAGLAAAHAVARFADLDPAVDDATARWAVAHCHLMRNRFTVVDLLDLSGHWTADDQEAVIAAAAAAVDGAHDGAGPVTG